MGKEINAKILNTKIDKHATLLWTFRAGTVVRDFMASIFDQKDLDYCNSGHVHVSVSADGLCIAVGVDHYERSSGKGYANIFFLNREGKLLWNYDTGGSIRSVSISPDGTYIAAGGGYKDEKVYFFNREGRLLWSYDVGNSDLKQILGTSVSKDGSYIAFWSHNKIYLLNKEGKLLWCYDTHSGHFGAACVTISQDSLYIAAGGAHGKLYLLNMEGNLLWSVHTSDDIENVSISSDGSHIASASLSGIRFFNRKGKLLWNFPEGDPVSVTGDGSYVAAGFGNIIYFINSEGKLLWRHEIDKYISGIFVSQDGSYMAVGADNKTVYFFKLNDEFLRINKVNRKPEEDVKDASEKRIITVGTKRESFENLVTINMPDKIKYGSEIELKVEAFNARDETIDTISIDFSEAADYFELSEKVLKLPQLKSNMRLAKSIKFKPLYEGNISFAVRIKSSLYEAVKDFTINVMGEK